MSLRFQQCFDPFNMLLFEGPSETGLFRQLSSHVFRTAEVQKYISDVGHLFLKMFKIEFKFRKRKKKFKKCFCFWDNCIWTSCNKLSLLRREYLSSAVSVLGKSPNILHITERDFLQLNCLHSDQ